MNEGYNLVEGNGEVNNEDPETEKRGRVNKLEKIKDKIN